MPVLTERTSQVLGVPRVEDSEWKGERALPKAVSVRNFAPCVLILQGWLMP